MTYCVKCKEKTETKGESVIESGKRHRKIGECAVYGTKKSQFVSSKQRGGNVELSSEAYKNPKNRRKEIDGYKLDETKNKRDIAVYKNDEGKTIIANRGTDLSKSGKAKSDLIEDALILTGLSNTSLSKRNKQSKKVTRQVIKEVGKDNVTLTGHSLGGRTSMNTANKLGVKAEVYNVGSAPIDILTAPFEKKNKNITHYTTGLDPISISAKIAGKTKIKTVKPTSLNTHSLSNFKK